MNYADYIPHRMLLNRSLRKASDELRKRVDEYQLEYERRVDEHEVTIAAAESEMKIEQEKTRAKLGSELDHVEVELRLLCGDISAYADCYLYYKYLQRIRSVRKSQFALYGENEAFLSKQMKLIGDEIEILRARKDELSALVDVSDFIELSGLSGGPLKLDNCGDCHSMLKYVASLLNGQADNHKSEHYAIKRLKLIVQERAVHLHTIQYINWIIRQKKLYSAQLSRKRNAIREAKGETAKIIAALKREVADVDRELNVLAERVRMHWVQPIISLSADRSYAIQRKKEVGSKLYSIAVKHVYYPNWDDLVSQRERLEDESRRLKDEEEIWYGRRRFVFGICKNNGIPLRTDGAKGKRDEKKVVKTRLAEIQTIRDEGIAEAEAECEKKRQRITSEWDGRLQTLNGELSDIEDRIRNLEEQKRNALCEVAAVTRRLRAAEAADKRFFLFRIVPTREISSAKILLEQASFRHAAIVEKLAGIENDKNEKQAEISGETTQYKRRLRACEPRYLRPNADELLEEKKLQLLLEKLENGQRREPRR